MSQGSKDEAGAVGAGRVPARDEAARSRAGQEFALDPRVTSAMISDALDVIGRRRNVLAAEIRPLGTPRRLVGPAVTLQFAPIEEDSEAPYDDAIEFIDSIQPGEVVVIAAGASRRSAFWGELFSAAATGRGAAGVVCDGYLRDTEKVLALGFRAFSRGSRPVDFRARMRVVGLRQAVECGGVRVATGDLIVGDADGVVSVPREVLDRVLDLARERAVRETTVLEELLAGATLREVWERHRML
jgi:4-hydroxy-4-methyl-2-oxoglutarate aldolase